MVLSDSCPRHRRGRDSRPRVDARAAPRLDEFGAGGFEEVKVPLSPALLPHFQRTALDVEADVWVYPSPRSRELPFPRRARSPRSGSSPRVSSKK